jgi:F-type H+-transporting ATPase subunit delta
MSVPRNIREVANALVAVAAENHTVSRALADLKTVEAAFAANPDLAILLQDQGIPFSDRQEALRKALADDIHIYVINALSELQQMRMLEELETFLNTVVEYARTKADHVDAVVYSAVKLTGEEKARIEKALHDRFRGSVSLQERLDHGIQGGLIIEAGDWRFDGSIKGQISLLKQALSA